MLGALMTWLEAMAERLPKPVRFVHCRPAPAQPQPPPSPPQPAPPEWVRLRGGLRRALSRSRSLTSAFSMK